MKVFLGTFAGAWFVWMFIIALVDDDISEVKMISWAAFLALLIATVVWSVA